jgi:hypothetical protein
MPARPLKNGTRPPHLSSDDFRCKAGREFDDAKHYAVTNPSGIANSGLSSAGCVAATQFRSIAALAAARLAMALA